MTTSLIFVPNFKVLFLCLDHNIKTIIIGFCLAVVFYAAFLFVAGLSMIGSPEWGWSVVRLMDNANGMAFLLFNLWGCQLISFVYERYILKKVLYSQAKKEFADFGDLKGFTNGQILKDLEMPMYIILGWEVGIMGF